jgi:hypothetical protein
MQLTSAKEESVPGDLAVCSSPWIRIKIKHQKKMKLLIDPPACPSFPRARRLMWNGSFSLRNLGLDEGYISEQHASYNNLRSPQGSPMTVYILSTVCSTIHPDSRCRVLLLWWCLRCSGTSVAHEVCPLSLNWFLFEIFPSVN